MFYHHSHFIFTDILINNLPHALCQITGGSDYPSIYGTVKLYATCQKGVLVEAEIFNLPPTPTSFFAFHIHENGDCSNHFANTGDHYNPSKTNHPNHAGDLPPLLSNNGYAWTVFYTERFSISQVLGRSIIIHHQPDDFTSQPSGNAGEKIACGIIKPI